MARIEKTVFISYRRTDVYTALAVYENLKNQGYDVFFDYRSISSGDFEQIITSNIRARAHFLLILTPTALDRVNEPGDWLRREIEIAIDEKRNIVPLFFRGFRFGSASKSGVSRWLSVGKPEVLTGKLKDLSRYNGLNVHEDYFEEAMTRLRTEYLSKPLDTVLHPISTEVRKVVKEEQDAADEALKQKEVTKEPVKQVEEKPVDKKESPKPIISTPQLIEKPSEKRAPAKAFPYRLEVSFLVLLGLCIWGGINLWNNLSSARFEPTQTSQPTPTQTLQSNVTPTIWLTASRIPQPMKSSTPSITPTITPSKTPEPDILNPQEEPVSVWNDIPIMPQAIKGYGLINENRYSFTIDATPIEIATYYDGILKKAGWTTNSGWFLPGGDGGIQVYNKDGKELVFLISAHGDLFLVRMAYVDRTP